MDLSLGTFEDLYRRAHITSKNRFNASKRLADHNQAALVTITLMSLGLIAIPLIKEFELGAHFGTRYVDFFQLFLAIVVLVISVSINSANFGRRSEKLHDCGLELSNLARKIYGFVNDGGSREIYNDFVNAYYEILNRYENHKSIDFRITQIDFPDQYSVNKWTRAMTWVLYKLDFSFYAMLVLIEFLWIYFLIR